ncbi:DUF1348 family protein [Nocardia grenadensis]|uniref:DUF1348 family protein n=1 Tax=Nocardia grenadensis TaxID=931537 RepID=UPI0035A2456C
MSSASRVRFARRSRAGQARRFQPDPQTGHIGAQVARAVLDPSRVQQIEGRRFTEVGALIEHAWWWCSYGNEQQEFAPDGLVARREASIDDIPITWAQRRIHGPRPEGDTTELPQ